MKIKILLVSAIILLLTGWLLGETRTGCLQPGWGVGTRGLTPSISACEPTIIYSAILIYYPAIALAISVGYYAFVSEGNRSRSYLIVMLMALAVFSSLMYLIYLSAKSSFQ